MSRSASSCARTGSSSRSPTTAPGSSPSQARRDGDGRDLAEGGLGIAIIRSIADELEIGAQPHGRGSRLRFVKLL